MKLIYCFLVLLFSSLRAIAQPGQAFPQYSIDRKDSSDKTYSWPDESTDALRVFRVLLDSCRYQGLNKYDYHYSELYDQEKVPVSTKERLLYDGFASYFNDLSNGKNIAGCIGYNGLSKADHPRDLNRIATVLFNHSEDEIRGVFKNLEPVSQEYHLLKDALAEQIANGNIAGEQQLRYTLNLYRWMLHFQFNRFIIVNIASAQLKMYNVDSPVLAMKAVLGKPSTRTPRLAAYVNEIVFYPYWHVPRSITINELLPLFKRSSSFIKAMNIEVINNSGRVVDSREIPWSQLSKNYFPYQLRQGTGCGNALGVIKFNLTSPYSVYLHDTNLKSAFASSQRYFSHGCIRIEKPLELAQLLSSKVVDSNFVHACIRGQMPVVEKLAQPIPKWLIILCISIMEFEIQSSLC